MAWADDIAALHDDVFAGLGERVTWPGGAVTHAIIEARTEPRLYETQVSETVWTIEFISGVISASRGMHVIRNRDSSEWALGEKTAADDMTETWSIRKL
jgi:hypothetical protein